MCIPKLVELTKTEQALVITPTPLGISEVVWLSAPMKSPTDSWYELLEYHLCNGWDTIRPEEIGALTGCPFIISDDVERDDHGKITRLGDVYWYEPYAVFDPVEILANAGSVSLDRVRPEKKQ